MGNLVMFSSIFYDEDIDKSIKEFLPQNSKIGIIPAETRFFKDSPLTESGEISEYKEYGYTDFLWFDLGYEYNSALEDKLFECDAIHLCGGNTFLLLYLLKKRGFVEKLRKFYNNGGTIIGNSAGSIVMCPDIRIAAFADYNMTRTADYNSLHLVDFMVKPHWEMWENKISMFQMFADTCNINIFTLKENQCIMKTDKYGFILFNNPLAICPQKVEGAKQ